MWTAFEKISEFTACNFSRPTPSSRRYACFGWGSLAFLANNYHDILQF